jgi:hypothetical protein
MDAISQLKLEIANENKRGISFLISASIYWLVVGIVGNMMNAKTAFIISLWGTGSSFRQVFLFQK